MSKKRRIAIINVDDDPARVIRKTAGLPDADEPAESFGSPQAAADFLSGSEPAVVFFGIDRDTEGALAAIQQFSETSSRSAVVGITNNVSSELLIEAVRAGIDEFLTPPLNEQKITDSVRNACRKKGLLQSDSSRGEGKLLTVFSGKGGCGKTMFATNLAYHLSQFETLSVLLIDLNLQFGNAASFLDLHPRHTIIDCLHRNTIVEEEVVVRMPTKHSSGLAVLAGPEDPADGEQIQPEHVQALLDVYRQRYDYVIVDTASNFDERNLTALDMSDRIVLLSDTLVPSVQNSQRCLRVFDKLGYDTDKIMLVINRFDKRVGARPKELQQAFGRPIDALIPNDFNQVINAVDAGLPVAEVAERSEVVSEIQKLALAFAGEEATPQDHGLFRRLSELITK